MKEIPRVTFRRPRLRLEPIVEALTHAHDCQEFVMAAPVVYIGDLSNSFMLRLQSVQGPCNGTDSDVVMARRLLTILLDHGVIASARMPGGGEAMLKPLPKEDKSRHA